MTYQEAKELKQKVNEKNQFYADKLKEVEEKHGILSGELTPDHVRELAEWKEAKQNFDASFIELRNFNSWFMKAFKKEYAKDRKNRYTTK